jgi:hypothetical protein
MIRYFRRVIGAVLLDVTAYEDVEADTSATSHACLTVLLSSATTAVGIQRLWPGAASLPELAIGALLAWASWALLTFEVGARLLPGPRTHADVGELLRTLGFAASPALLLVFGIIPGMTVPIVTLVMLWLVVTMVVAVRQALDYSSTARAIAVCLVGWGLTIAIGLVGAFLFAPSVS